VDGLEFVTAGSDFGGDESTGGVVVVGGLLTRLEGHGNVIVKDIFFLSSFG
jgi:hypothetical protein